MPFRAAAHEIMRHQMAPDWTSCAEKMSRLMDSLLVRISDNDFRTGIVALQERVKNARPENR